MSRPVHLPRWRPARRPAPLTPTGRRDLLAAARRRVVRWSLRSRLPWSATVVIAVWVVVVAIGVNLLLTKALSGQADSVLSARAEAVASTVRVDPSGAVHIRTSDEDWALDIGTWVIAGDGTVVKRPEGATQELTLTALYLSTQGDAKRDVPSSSLRLLALPVRNADHQQVATVVTSTSLAPYGRLQRVFLWATVAVAVLLLGMVHLALRATVRRALRPVQEMTEQAGRWSADEVDRRFGLADRPAELAELALTLDGVLHRVAAALRHEQRLTGELSHELRTPLARVRGELDLVRNRRPSDPAVVDGVAAMDAAVTDMQQIIETLLSAGRAGVRTAPGRCRPAEVVSALSGPAGEGCSLRNDVDPDLVVGVDGAVLQRLLAPVVENARRYATGSVTVRSHEVDGAVRLVVDDDGPGIAAEDVDSVFDPGWSADPGAGHAGLGLALTRRLADACGGSVRAVARPEGGRFEVTVPAG